MKSISLTLALATMASTAFAQSFEIPFGSGRRGPQRPDTVPTEQLSPSQFPWTDPFADMTDFTPTCTASKTFKAWEFKLDDMQESFPLGPAPYFSVLKDVLGKREYPGSWDGKDPHGYDRHIIQMDYVNVPVRVREWIEAQERDPEARMEDKTLFVVFDRQAEGEIAKAAAKLPDIGADRKGDDDKVVLFAPGAVYGLLPLWVAEGSDCEGEFFYDPPGNMSQANSG
jgi:hypothetical protein